MTTLTDSSLRAFENAAYSNGYRYVAGVDEAGRGPLAGPVVAAACVMPVHVDIPGINDSKKLSPRQRKDLYEILMNHPEVSIGIGVIQASEIDRINILQAALKAMAKAVLALELVPDYLLIDGNHLPPTHIASKAVIKGDSRSLSIGAASIIAKHYRDQLMVELNETYPQYGFFTHKGYGTKKHLEALNRYGPCREHRKTFSPVRNWQENVNNTSKCDVDSHKIFPPIY